MKRLFSHLFSFVFALINFLTVGSSNATEVWKITSLNWPPYSGGELDNQGESIATLRALIKTKGIKLVVEFYPWKRAQMIAQDSQYVGYFPAWPEEVNSGFIGSLPVAYSNIGFTALANTTIPDIPLANIFKQYRVGFIRDYAYPNRYEQLLMSNYRNVSSTLNEVMLLDMLKQNRFDFALTDPAVLNFNAKKDKSYSGAIKHKVLEKHPLVVAMRDTPDNQQNIKTLNLLLVHHEASEPLLVETASEH